MLINSTVKGKMPTTVELNGEDMPELKDVHVDNVITVTMKLKATRITEGGYKDYYCDCPKCNSTADCKDCKKCEPQDLSKKISANFEVQSVTFSGIDDTAEDKTEKEPNTPEGKVASKYNQLVKKGMNPANAMAMARKA